MSATASVFATPSAVIGKTIVIKGEIQSQEPLTIEGRIEGTIEISDHLLTVAYGADVRAHITGSSVEVQGRVEGQVEAADTVYIRRDAEFIGDIYASSLIVEEGGYIKGKIDLTRQLAESPCERGTSPSGRCGLSESPDMGELSHALLRS